MLHPIKVCCLAACGLQSAVAPLNASMERRAEFERLLFTKFASRLTGRPVPPAFEPPLLVSTRN